MLEKKVQGREFPWLTSEIKRVMVDRDYYLRKACGTGKEIYWSMYKRLRNDETRKIYHSRNMYRHSIFKENISLPKQFWNQMKRVTM